MKDIIGYIIYEKERVIFLIKKLLLLPCILLLVGLYILGNAISIWNYANYDQAKKADVIIVLGASVEYTRVSPVYRERINHAIDLYNKGYAKYIIFTGGKIAGQDYSDSSVAKYYAIDKGVDEDNIFIEEKSTYTKENLQYAKQIMDQKGFSSAIVVSDPLHMKRGMLMAKDVGIATAYSSPTPTTMYKSRSAKINFLKKELFVYIAYKFYRIGILFTSFL